MKASHTIQHFNAAVGKVAGRDIIENNITSIILLNTLEKAVQESNDIPEDQKEGILQKIRSLAADPYVSGIATSAIWEGLKNASNLFS